MIEPYVIDVDGTRATLESQDRDQAFIRLEDGRLVAVPRSTLVEQDDGSYRAAFSLTRFQQDGVMVIPLVEEAINVDKREVERKVRVTKTVRSENVVVDEPLNREDIDVERVMINRYVEGELPVRTEGDTTIIPLVEEVLVVEKRLLLREEIHIKRQQRAISNPQAYTLRREDIHVEREDESTGS